MGAVDRTKPRHTRRYLCLCNQPITVETWNGYGYQVDRHVYRDGERAIRTCPGCGRTLSMAWLGQRP